MRVGGIIQELLIEIRLLLTVLTGTSIVVSSYYTLVCLVQ